MRLNYWLGDIVVRICQAAKCDVRSRRSRPAVSRLQIEPLEDRTLLSTVYAANDAFMTMHDQLMTVSASGVLMNDTTSDAQSGPLSASLVTGPANGSLSFSSDGSFVYVPETGFVGTASFTYQASDGTDFSNVATVSISVINSAPHAENDSYGTPHDQPFSVSAPGVLSNDYDMEGDPITPTVVSGTSHGALMLHSDGSFTYTPNAFYVGSDSFTYKLSDGIADSSTATVTITMTNNPPVATNDLAAVMMDEATPSPVAIHVLDNDFDLDGDDFYITGVSSSVEGASLSIDSSGTFIWYTPPTFAETEATIGGEVPADFDIPEQSEGAETTSSNDGIEPFTDSFQYTITGLGGTSTAFVQVRGNAPLSWEYKISPQFDTKDEVKIDGKFGYEAHLKQSIGKNARGARLPEQTWQQNLYSAKYLYLSASNELKGANVTNEVLADTRSTNGARTPYTIDDKLLTTNKPGQIPLFMIESVDKKLGFNKAGKLLPEPEPQPWRPKPADCAILAQMRGPTKTISTMYLFIDKAKIEALHAAGTITNLGYNQIKAAVEQGSATSWDNLPDKYESLQIGDLALWSYSSP